MKPLEEPVFKKLLLTHIFFNVSLPKLRVYVIDIMRDYFPNNNELQKEFSVSIKLTKFITSNCHLKKIILEQDLQFQANRSFNSNFRLESKGKNEWQLTYLGFNSANYILENQFI